MAEIQKIGRLGKTHGYKGAIKITIVPEAIPFFVKQNALFLNIKGEEIPFFYKIVSEFLNDSCIIELEEITSKEEAQKLTGKEVSIQSKKPIIKVEKDLGIIGYTIIDEEKGEIGTIDDLIEMSHQSLIQVNYKEKEVLIPLHPDFILKVDKSKKIIYLNLPEGILEI
jgi:16S rRNA processing protein RimM